MNTQIELPNYGYGNGGVCRTDLHFYHYLESIVIVACQQLLYWRQGRVGSALGSWAWAVCSVLQWCEVVYCVRAKNFTFAFSPFNTHGFISSLPPNNWPSRIN